MKAGPLNRTGKKILGLLLAISLPILPGCWDQTELNEIALIRAVGIDRTEDGQIEVTVLQAIPVSAGTNSGSGGAGGGGGKDRQVVLSAQAPTIPEAKEQLQEKMGRRLFVGHQEVVVFGKRIAESGIREALDFLARQPQIRMDAFVFVTEGSPKEIFETVVPGETTATETLYKMIKLERRVDMTVMRVLQEMSGDAESAVIPVVMKVNDTTLALDGAAIFRKDQMVAHLDRNAEEGLLWIREEFTSRTINARLPEEEGYVTMEVIRADVRLIPKIEGDKRRMLVKVNSEDDVQFNGTRLSLYHPANMDRIGREMEKSIQNRLRRTVEMAQRARADVLGFARAFHRKYPKEWKKMKDQWNERMFPQLDVDIQVRVHVRRPGVTDQPAGLPGEELKQ